MVDWHQAWRAVEAVDVQKQVAAVSVFVDDADVQNANLVDGRHRQLVDVAATPLVFVGRFAVQEVLLQDARIFAPLEFELKLLAPIHISGVMVVAILHVISRKYFKNSRKVHASKSVTLTKVCLFDWETPSISLSVSYLNGWQDAGEAKVIEVVRRYFFLGNFRSANAAISSSIRRRVRGQSSRRS